MLAPARCAHPGALPWRQQAHGGWDDEITDDRSRPGSGDCVLDIGDRHVVSFRDGRPVTAEGTWWIRALPSCPGEPLHMPEDPHRAGHDLSDREPSRPIPGGRRVHRGAGQPNRFEIEAAARVHRLHTLGRQRLLHLFQQCFGVLRELGGGQPARRLEVQAKAFVHGCRSPRGPNERTRLSVPYSTTTGTGGVQTLNVTGSGRYGRTAPPAPPATATHCGSSRSTARSAAPAVAARPTRR